MGTKTPYEIRLELLKLSYEILFAQCEARSNKKAVEEDKAGGTVFRVESPTAEDVIKTATSLNEFVSNTK